MNSSKSPGYDNISTSFIKYGMYELAQPLSYLLNLSLDQCTFPSAEKVAKVKPLYKSEEHCLLTNYRPISVLPALSKLFELVIHDQLYEYLEENKLLTKFQFGFRKNRSSYSACCDTFIRLYSFWYG